MYLATMFMYRQGYREAFGIYILQQDEIAPRYCLVAKRSPSSLPLDSIDRQHSAILVAKKAN